MSLQIKKRPFELNGHVYRLCANMAVLDAVQDAYGDNLSAALHDPNGIRSVMTFLAAMLNDAAEDDGLDEQWNPRKVEKLLPLSALSEVRTLVMELVAESVRGDAPAPSVPDSGTEEDIMNYDPKN